MFPNVPIRKQRQQIVPLQKYIVSVNFKFELNDGVAVSADDSILKYQLVRGSRY